MEKSKMPYYILAVVLGALLFVYGGYDDSPGGQLMGLVIVIIGIVGVLKRRKENPDRSNVSSVILSST